MNVAQGVAEYLLLSLFIAPISLRYARMDRRGSAAAFLVGFVVYLSLGFRGFLVLFSLHLTGAVVTRFGYDLKKSRGVAQNSRGFENVLANGFFPALAAALSAVIKGWSGPFFIAYVSAVAAATADTASSEIGELSKSKPRMVTNLREAETGTDGAVSPLGTLAGFGGSALIALIAVILNQGLAVTWFFLIVIFSGFMGTMVDSLLGATLEKRNLLNNEAVNLLSIGAASALSVILYVTV